MSVADPHRASAPTPASRLSGLKPYRRQADHRPIDLQLDANEGRPAKDALLEVLRSLDEETLCRYPHADDLEAKLAGRLGVDPARVVVTCGADDAIDRICRAVLEPGREVLIHDPTFEMIPHNSRLAGGSVRSVTWVEGLFPLSEFLSRIGPETRLVSLVTPNNPTGGVIGLDEILEVASAAPGAVILVDLAYAEFGDDDPMPSLLDIPNVVVTRTFSKAMGLAGLRVGYAVAPREIADWLRTVGSPYPVSGVSLALAGASLDLDSSGYIRQVRSERGRLPSRLSAVGCSVCASQANFLSVRARDALFMRDAAAALGIALRGFPSRPDLADMLRVTLPGDEASFERLARALEAAARPEAMIFDMDGVLADVTGSYRAAITATADAFGVRVTSSDIASAKQQGNASNDWELTLRLILAGGKTASIQEVTDRFQAFYLGSPGRPGFREREKLIPDAGTLARLAARLPLAIVTARPRDEAAWFLRWAGISEYFSTVVCMEDAAMKPSPEPVFLALERLGIARAWMVGDTLDDILAARGAGVVPLAIASPSDDPAPARAALALGGAARVLESLDQLETLLP